MYLSKNNVFTPRFFPFFQEYLFQGVRFVVTFGLAHKYAASTPFPNVLHNVVLFVDIKRRIWHFDIASVKYI